MSAPRIPERQPIGDPFRGVVIAVDETHLLAATAPPDYSPVFEGDFVIRYGVVYLGKPQYSIVPSLMAIDYGQFLTGDAAWEFLFKKSNLYPRADVIGYRNDGEDEMIVVKSLDLEYPVDVLVYENDSATKPLATVKALIAPEDSEVVPRILDYLPRYDTIADWQSR